MMTPTTKKNHFSKLSLATNLTEHVNQSAKGLDDGNAEILNQVSPTTRELLTWWFHKDNMEHRYNFHSGQKQAILNTIYAHEVLQCDNLHALYRQINLETLAGNSDINEELQTEKYQHRQYCMKMATGSGKTWVLEALLIWQILNAKEAPDNPLFTKNFLIIAPGLIVYDRLLNAFLGKEETRKRDFKTSDFYKYAELLIPKKYQNSIFSFIENSTCPKEEIVNKTTGGGFIGIINWQAIKEEKEKSNDNIFEAPGISVDPKAIVEDILPMLPNDSDGRDLDKINRKIEKEKILDFLKDLPSLMVFNDEAHHVYSVESGKELKWQKTLTTISANKRDKFHQIDFTATPYREKGKEQFYFPHIITDYDLSTAIKEGIVKSLTLEKRQETDTLSNDELNFKAIKDIHENIILSEGQRTMLNAGLAKLDILAKEFATIPPKRHPKMMIVCEDTKVVPKVEEHFIEMGVAKDEILRIDTNSKGDVKPEQWNKIRRQLFDMDKHDKPRIIISVLMLREGFDVNNICVIVPLRSSESKTLIEQTIGRGLRLMWREDDYEIDKQENRKRISEGKKPESLIDVLHIIEHPKFIEFYDELKQKGLVKEIDEKDAPKPAGNRIPVKLIKNYNDYDIPIPIIIKEREEALINEPININDMPPINNFNLNELKSLIRKGETFYSEEVLEKLRFDNYQVESGITSITGYNTCLARLSRHINKVPESDSAKKNPYLQIAEAELTGKLDKYIKTRLFGEAFNPREDENWRVLLHDAVFEYIVNTWQSKIAEPPKLKTTDEVVETVFLSEEVNEFCVREDDSVEAKKSIYERFEIPHEKAGLEKAFIEACNSDDSVQAICKIIAGKHLQKRLQYKKESGGVGYYYPDFLVQIDDHIFLVETKASNQINQPDVQAKAKAAASWCQKINLLNDKLRPEREWAYSLLDERTFDKRLKAGQNIADILRSTEYPRPKNYSKDKKD